jgi:hypothetical protein
MVELTVLTQSHPRGYANIRGDNMTVFLGSIAEYFQYRHWNDIHLFYDYAQAFEYLVIHELCHVFTGVREDRLVDGWIRLTCPSYIQNGSCLCPVDCPFRE